MTNVPISEFAVEGIVRSNVIHPEHLFTRIIQVPNATYKIWNYEFYVALPDIERSGGGIRQVIVHGKPCGDSFPIEIKMEPSQTEILWWFAPYSKAEIVLLLSEVKKEQETIQRIGLWFVSDAYPQDESDLIRNVVWEVAKQVGFDPEGKTGLWTCSVRTAPAAQQGGV